MSNSLTVIITASYIPSHPSIEIIQKTIESLSYINLLKHTKIILAHDGLLAKKNNEKANSILYEEYLENLRKYITSLPLNHCPNIEITRCTNHVHLTGNVRNAMSTVTTKYVLVIQHDLPFFREFDIQKVIQDMNENENLKHIRFNKRSNIKAVSDIGRTSEASQLFGLQVKQTNYTYTRTPSWADNNHICKTQYYNDIVLKECSDGRAMEHDLMKKIRNETTHKKYGTFIFGQLNNPAVIKHTDGRRHKKRRK